MSRSDLAAATRQSPPAAPIPGASIVVVGHLGSAAASLKLAAALHAEAPRLPILLATKAAMEIRAENLVAAGIFDVVHWPIVAEEIALALARGPGGKRATLPRPPPDRPPAPSLH